MKKPICSNEHFHRLLKSFKKISQRVCDDYMDAKFYESFVEFVSNHSLYDNYSFEKSLNNLFKNFKSNPFKTKSGITSIRYDMGTKSGLSKFFVTYTFEDDFGKRSPTLLSPKNIVFRIYIQEGYRKKRLVKWSVPVTWEHLK